MSYPITRLVSYGQIFEKVGFSFHPFGSSVHPFESRLHDLLILLIQHLIWDNEQGCWIFFPLFFGPSNVVVDGF